MVYKTPSDDEQQREEEETGSIAPVYPRQSAMARKAAARPRKAFYADEHPEVPQVRRASLKQKRAEVLPTSEHGLEEDDSSTLSAGETGPQPRLTSKHKRAAAPPFTGLETYHENSPTRGETGPQARLTSNPKRPEMLPFTGLESASNAVKREQHAARKTSSHTTGMHPIIVRPPRQRRNNRSRALAQMRRIRRKTWLLIGLLALLVLVLTPILAGIVHNLTPQPNSTTANISIERLQSVPSNPHELVIVPPNTDHPAPPVLATSAYLLDTSGETTLYAQNPYLHLPMLSTTKLMTASLAVETGNLDKEITITPAMEQDISQLSADSALFGVKLGETYTLRDLLYGLLYVSGNDAALVIADALAGSMPNFVAEMNQKAQELGLRDTHFVNPHGLLNAGQYSCARDLAVLGQYSLSIPALQQISDGRSYQIAAGGNHGVRMVLNENQFLWWYPGVTGGKTGFDGVSDFVQVMQVTRNGRHMIGVVMHTDNWWTDMRNMMDYGSGDYTWNSPHDVEQAGQPIPYDNLWNYFAKDTQNVSVPTANNGLYYTYSGYSIAGPILVYFNQQGGLKTFGFPIKMPLPSGATLMTQQFQHGAILCDLSKNQCRTV